MLVFAVGLVSAYPGDVFRYSDETSKQSHFMEGEPGSQVSGGWQFESPEGKNFELTYKADELGFQPQADYLPLQVGFERKNDNKSFVLMPWLQAQFTDVFYIISRFRL